MSADKNENKKKEKKAADAKDKTQVKTDKVKTSKEGKDAKDARVKPKTPSEARLQRRADDEKIVRRIKIVFVSIIVIAVIGISFGVFMTTYKPTVAWVGKTSIKLPEFNYFLSMAKSELRNSLDVDEYEDEAGFWESNVSGTRVIDLAKENALQNVQQMKINITKAKERNLKLDSDETANVKSLIDGMVETANGDRSAASKESLETNGVTLGELQKIFKQMYLSEKFGNELGDEVLKGVTDEEAQAWYDEHTDEYERVTVRHILISYEGTEENPRTPEESAALANVTLTRVVTGEDFASLVEELTDDTASIPTGGEYTFGRNEGYVEPFETWSFNAEIGDVDIVETEFGYHIMRLEDKQIAPFEDMKESITYEIASAALQELYEGWASDAQFELRENDSVYKEISWQWS